MVLIEAIRGVQEWTAAVVLSMAESAVIAEAAGLEVIAEKRKFFREHSFPFQPIRKITGFFPSDIEIILPTETRNSTSCPFIYINACFNI